MNQDDVDKFLRQSLCFELAEGRVPYHILLETTIQRMNPQVAIHLHPVHMFLQGKVKYVLTYEMQYE